MVNSDTLLVVLYYMKVKEMFNVIDGQFGGIQAKSFRNDL